MASCYVNSEVLHSSARLFSKSPPTNEDRVAVLLIEVWESGRPLHAPVTVRTQGPTQTGCKAALNRERGRDRLPADRAGPHHRKSGSAEARVQSGTGTALYYYTSAILSPPKQSKEDEDGCNCPYAERSGLGHGLGGNPLAQQHDLHCRIMNHGKQTSQCPAKARRPHRMWSQVEIEKLQLLDQRLRRS